MLLKTIMRKMEKNVNSNSGTVWIWCSLSNDGTQTLNHLVRKWTLNHLAQPAKWMSCTVSSYLYDELGWCFYHVTYALWVNQHSEWVDLYLNVKELLAWNRLDIWRLSDCNRTRTHNQLIRIRKPSRSITKLSPLKGRNSEYQKLHHYRGVDTNF